MLDGRVSEAMRCPYRPMEFNVVVELDPVQEKTAGGIILPESKKERDELAAEEGTLVAASPLAFSYASPSEWGDEHPPQVGQRVMIARYQGVAKEHDGRKFRIVKDKDVVAVIEGGE